MQVASNKVAILGIGSRVSSTRARVETIGIVEVSIEVGIVTIGEVRRTSLIIGVFREFKVGFKVRVSIEVGIVTIGEIRRTSLIIGVFRGFKVGFKVGVRGFKVGVGSSSKS